MLEGPAPRPIPFHDKGTRHQPTGNGAVSRPGGQANRLCGLINTILAMAGRPPVNEVAFGPYRLIRLIGDGGMGKAYRGDDPGLEREEAIEVLPSELAAEARRKSPHRVECRTSPCAGAVLGSTGHPVHAVQIGKHAAVEELPRGGAHSRAQRAILSLGDVDAHRARGVLDHEWPVGVRL